MNKDTDIGAVARLAAREVKQDEARRRSEIRQQGEKRRRLDSPVLLAVLAAVCLLLTALNLSGYGLLPAVAEPTAAELDRSVKQEIEFLDMDIEAYQEAYGEVPETIDAFVPPYVEAWSYEKLGAGSYRLSLTMDGQTAGSRKQIAG